MSANWIVNVGGQTYGPYTDAQMAAFAVEGRLSAQSLIARAGEDSFRPASVEPALAALFVPVSAQPTEEPGESAAPAPSREAPSFGRSDSQKTTEPSHIVVIADMKSRSITGLEEEVYRLGQAYALLPQVWLVRTEHTITTVRNQLIPKLGKLDRLFVVDATNDRAAWFNFGPESETRMRRIFARRSEPVIRAAE